MTELTSIRIPTNGIRLHAMTAGPVDGRPLILLHGFPEFWYSWRAQIPALAAAGIRVIAPDMRGYNLSDRPGQVSDYDLELLAADVTGIVDWLGVDQVDLVGHDWGGVVAWWAAGRHPERIRRLCILNVPHPAAYVDFVRQTPSQLLKSWYIFAIQIPGPAEWMLSRQNYRFAKAMVSATAVKGTVTREDRARYVEAWSQAGALRAMLNYYRAAARHYPGGLRALGRIRVPTRVIWGQQDVVLDQRLAQLSLDRCDEGDLKLFETASHWVQHDEAEGVSRLIIEWLAES